MFRLVGAAAFSAVLLTAWLANAAEVVKVNRSKIRIYANNRAVGGEVKKINRDELDLPAVVTSSESPKGLIQVQFRFKDGSKNALIGWVRKRDVTLSDRDTLHLGSCNSPGMGTKTVSRGSRGLGDGC